MLEGIQKTFFFIMANLEMAKNIHFKKFKNFTTWYNLYFCHLNTLWQCLFIISVSKYFPNLEMDFFCHLKLCPNRKMNSSLLLCITYWIFFGSISRQISLLYGHLFYSAFDWELVEPLSYGYHPSTSEAFCWHFCCICSLHIGAFW